MASVTCSNKIGFLTLRAWCAWPYLGEVDTGMFAVISGTNEAVAKASLMAGTSK